MIYISDSAIQYAVNLCREFNGFKAVIVSPDSEVRRRVIERLEELIIPEYDGPRNHRSDNTVICQFPNYSSLRVIGMSENMHGCRAHLLVVDINADKQFVNTVLKPFETLPYRPRNKSDAWYMIP